MLDGSFVKGWPANSTDETLKVAQGNREPVQSGAEQGRLHQELLAELCLLAVPRQLGHG